MNVQDLRKLISEEVRKAVREELRQVLVEHAASQLVESYKPVVAKKLNENFNLTTDSINMKKSKVDVKAQMDSMFGLKTKATERTDLQPPVAGDFSAFLMDSAQNISPEDYSGLKNM